MYKLRNKRGLKCIEAPGRVIAGGTYTNYESQYVWVHTKAGWSQTWHLLARLSVESGRKCWYRYWKCQNASCHLYHRFFIYVLYANYQNGTRTVFCIVLAWSVELETHWAFPKYTMHPMRLFIMFFLLFLSQGCQLHCGKCSVWASGRPRPQTWSC